MESANLNHWIEYYQSGASLHETSRKSGISTTCLRKWFRRRGVRMRPRTEGIQLERRQRMSAHPWETIFARYLAGESAPTLAREYGISEPYLRGRLRTNRILRSREVATKLAHSKIISNLDALITRYQAGETMGDLAREAGVKRSTLRNKLEERGVVIRNAQIVHYNAAVTPEEVARQYLAGRSANALAKAFGVSRTIIDARLLEADVSPRGRAEAALQTEASTQRAQTRYERQLNIRPTEHELASALRKQGVQLEQQWPVGTYNLDISFQLWPLAVEVEAGPALYYPQRAKLTARIEYLLDEGWAVLVVVTRYRPIDVPAITKQIVALLERTGRHKAAASSKYGVIGRDGKPLTKPRYQFNSLARIPGF